MAGMIDIIREMPMKPEICGCEDGTFWYRCPVCHDPLDYKQPECGWCHQKINWDGEKQ